MSISPAHPYVVIEGNIGAGKSTLATMLSRDFNARLILEEFEDNSFLPKFYEQPGRFAFPLEMSFLASRFNQLKHQLLETDLFQNTIVSDYMFAKCLLFSKVNLDEDEYELYGKLFDIINQQLPQPDLLVYLHHPLEKLKWNIINRGRPYELKINDDYLKHLWESYQEYFQANQNLRILVIDCASIDFVSNSDHYENIRALICKAYEPGIHYINWLIEE
ncbi:MAG: deoxynucleoside kinase [Bacteroidia bacterium]|jgi:deoxyadenosine/deoxycytidine kinase